jgi:uncharacterized protein YbjT (DUF2867 family)
MNREYLVIGGSAGVGLEIVRELSSRGDVVHAASRTQGGLADLPGVSWQPTTSPTARPSSPCRIASTASSTAPARSN